MVIWMFSMSWVHIYYESPLGTRSFMRHIATQDFPVSPGLTRDHFHTVFPLLSLGHDISWIYMILSFVRCHHCHVTHAEMNAAMSQFLTTDCKNSWCIYGNSVKTDCSITCLTFSSLVNLSQPHPNFWPSQMPTTINEWRRFCELLYAV